MSHLLVSILSLAAPSAGATTRLYEPFAASEPGPSGDEAPPVGLVPYTTTPEMREWVRTHVFEFGTEEERMRRLLTALSSDRNLTYDAAYTGTAAEVFETGHFNCLALTHLLVGLGRELGVDAYYVRVQQFRSFYKRADLVLVSTHVAAGWGPQGLIQIVELEPATERELRAASRIDDNQALALHLSNRGAEWLQASRPDVAREWLERALEVDQSAPEAWVNYGVAHRRLGELDGAEDAYRRAIDLDPDDLSAWRNLGLVLELRGDDHAADELLQLLDRRDNRNPFTFLALGDMNLDAGRLDEALRFYRRARRIETGNPDTLAALASWALAAGEPERARALLARAQAIDPDSERVRRLGTALAPVTVPGL